MQGISSKAAGKPEQKKKKFQGQEFSDELDVDVYEFKYRIHDPQTGRFWQIDPLADKYVHNSTYAFSENKVTSHVELEGLEAKDIHFDLEPVRELRAKNGIPPSTTTFEKVMDGVLLGVASLLGGAVAEILPVLGTAVNVGMNVAKNEESKAASEQSQNISKLEKDIKQLSKELKGQQKALKEHEKKLEVYKNDPKSSDNKNMLKDGESHIDEKVAGRTNFLNKTITRIESNIKKVTENLNNKKTELDQLNKKK